MKRILEAVEVEKPSFIFSFFGSESKVGKKVVEEYFEFLDLIGNQELAFCTLILHLVQGGTRRLKWREQIAEVI